VLDAARVEVRKRTAVVITATGTTITDIHSIGPLTAAIIIGRVGDIRRPAKKRCAPSSDTSATPSIND
jgi:transposase